MNPFNSYIDYVRDSFWLGDILFKFVFWIKQVVAKTANKVANFEFENYFFRIAENLPYGIFIMFLGFFFTINLVRLTEGEGGVRIFNITTNSMHPAISPGSLLVSIPQSKYQVGDIVSYKERNFKTDEVSGRIITHRIASKDVNNGFYEYSLKGDNNQNPDPRTIGTPDILGKVMINVPFLGYVDFLTKTVPGFIIFVVAPTILLVKEALRYAKQAS